MKRFGNRLLFGLLVLSFTAPSSGDEGEDNRWKYDEGIEFTSENFRIKIDNRIQARFTVEDPDEGPTKGSFDISRYKLRFRGEAFEDWGFLLQLDLANGSESDSDLLDDASLEFTRVQGAQVWLGQGKVHFGRQFMTNTGKFQFVEGSIATERFAHGRDVGVRLLGENKRQTYGYSVGIYNGNGINKDEGDNVDFLYVGRLIVTPLGEYELQETDLDRPDEMKLAIGVSAMTNTVGTEDVEETRVNRGGLEFAFKHKGWNVVAEFFTESVTPLVGESGDELDTDGYYVQAGYLFRNNFEIAARYSEILPELPEEDIREIGLAAGYYFPGNNRKVQADFRTLDFEAETGDPFIDRYEIRVQLQLIF